MPKRTHEDAERTKQAILESALRLFSRRGYESTSLSDIARFAGVPEGLFIGILRIRDRF